MRDWASGGGAKIERAKEHIAEFERASRNFLGSHPYTAVSQFDPQSSELRFVVQSDHTIDPRLAAIAADAIHNLRAPLDILWHQVWTKGAAGRRKQYFPFVANAQDLTTRFQSVKQTSQRDAVVILHATKSYSAGNKFFGPLNEIEVRDKHEVPILGQPPMRRLL
jgi:hypothetical protein